MIDIYDNNGNKLVLSDVLSDLPITEPCEHVEELMKSDYITLSWRDSEKYTLPVGAYIIYKETAFVLLEPYEPEQKSEDEYEYKPEFQHPKMYLGKVPFRYDTTDTMGEPISLIEFPYCGDINTLLILFCRTIEKEMGLAANTFSYVIVGEVDNIVNTTFSSLDILSALSNVANLLKCEWHIEWESKTLYFGHIMIDHDEVETLTLEVGRNIGVPSVRSSKEGFYNAYLPQGSTRNISNRAASGEYVQGDVRLALNKNDYPDGIIYTDDDGHVISSLPVGTKALIKPLVFDEIYPKIDLYAYNVRCRERYLLDENNEKVIDHYEEGQPVYKKYAVWYIRLAYPIKTGQNVTEWRDYTINPETDLISGKELYGAFQPNPYSGAETTPLAGRGRGDDGGYGFGLHYHTTAEHIPANPTDGDTGIDILEGDYEIVFQEQGDYILPTTKSQGIIPKGVKVGGQEVTNLNQLANKNDGQKGNIVDLYNIVIGSEYEESAQNDLENETLKYIANQFTDNNSYSFKSDYVEFKKMYDNDVLLNQDSHLYIGRKVIYKNGDYQLETRLMKIVTKLDYEFCQEITVGNEVLKGAQTTLKEQVKTILAGGVGGGGGIDLNAVRRVVANYTNPRFLSKLDDDTAQGFITFLKGLQVGNQFVSGLLGEGGVFRKDADGKVYIEADKLYVRMKAYFDNVEIKDYEHTSGNRIASKAGLKCVKVEAYNSNDVLLATNPQTEPIGTSYYRLYFRAKDGEDSINNDFVNGDQAFCDKTTYDNNIISHHRYWRLVVGKNGNLSDTDEFGFIDLSASDKESGSDVPQAGDDVSQLGNRTNTERQGAIIEFVGGDNAPAYQIYQGINTYSLSGKCMIDMGFDSQTGLARMNVAGNFRFGSPLNTGSYIKYDSQANQGQGELKIKAHVEFTNSDAELDALVQEHQTTYDDSAVWSEMDNLQDQIDGAIESWFLTGVPTLQNAPANTWTTDAEKNNHIGDLYYDKATGHGYRFMYDNEEEVYLWTPIADEDIARALENAAKAQETADGKRTVYSAWNAWVKDNVNTLEVGDLFIPTANTTQGGVTYKANKVYKCITKGSAVFQSADYIDDAQAQAKVDAFVSGTYATDKQNLQSQIDGKAETYRQATDPALSWTDADKPKHVGDLWMDISSNGGKKTYIYEDKGASASPRYNWEAQDVPDAVFDEIDGKSTIYGNAIATPPTNYKKDDMWLLPADATINGVNYKAGDVLSASQDSATYSATHWSKRVRYTDDTKADSILNDKYYIKLTGGTYDTGISEAKSAAATAQSTANTARDNAAAANTRLTTWADDTKISPTEKLALKNQKADVMKEYAQIITDAAKYTGVSTTAFTTAYNKAITAFNYYTASTPENIAIITDSQTDSDATPRYSRIADYYAARQTILEAITTAAKNYATTQGNKFLDDAVYRAISAALGSNTDIVGGLVLTSLIGMRDSSEQVWGGISGQYDATAYGYGIAAWYGGAMVDKEVTPSASNHAKSLFRMDGSGYLAGGNITWDATGRVTIKDLHTDDGGTPTDVLQEMSAFREMFDLSVWSSATRIKPLQNFEQLKITRPSGYTITDNDVLTRNENDARYMLIDRFLDLFDVYNGSTNYSATFKTSGLPTDRTNISIKAKFDFWSQGGITALGQGSQGGGGGGSTTLYGLNDVSKNAAGDGVLGAADGYVLTYNATTNHWYAAPTPETYVLPTATAAALGGIKIGFATSGKNYAVQLANGQAYVNVPWENTTYTLAGLIGSSAIGSTTQPIYWNGSAFANTTYTLGKSVPSDAKFTDTTYSAGTGLALSSNAFSINSTYQTYISNGNTAYGWGNHANAGYLLKSGGTMTGILTLWGSQYNAYDTGSGALNLNNSDITGVNSILTADLSESWKESIGFKRTNGNYDTFRAADGTFYFGVNNGTEYTALHSGNSSVSKSGETLTVKINGTSYSLTNTNTTYSASTGLSLSGTAFSVSYAPKVLGSYTSNGGQQNPNYFGTNRVGFLMMNTTVNSNSQYKDWIIMDCYSGNDVGGGVAIGVNRQSLGAYIMRSAAARTSWAESAELCGTHNSSVSLSGSTLTVKIAGVEKSLTNTNTWRGIQDNLTSSTNTTESLSAKQGYLLANGSARDNTKLPLAGGTLTGTLTARDVVVQSNYSLKIGDAYLSYDSTNNAICVSKNADGTGAANFYALGGVSALGASEGGGGGGSTTLYGLNDVSKNAAGDGVLGAQNGYVLTYNATTNHWYAAPTAPIYSAGTGLALSSNTFSINSTYQTYISNGNTAYGYFTNGVANKSACLSTDGKIQSQAALDSFHEGYKLKYGIWADFTPTGLYTNGIIIDGGYVSANYGFQIAIDDDTTYKIHLRQKNTSGWADWKQIPMGDGTGASGTWGINITGSAGSVAWGNVSGRPTALSSFINDSGYITSSGSCASATTASRLASTTIPENANLNDYKTTGVYGQLSGATIGTFTNKPSDSIVGEMRLEVIGCNNSSSYLFQKYWGRNSSNQWELQIRTYNGSTWSSWAKNIDSRNIGSQSVSYANSAGSVAWSNVSGRPTNVSSFTNDSGYITSSGSCAYASKSTYIATAENLDTAEKVDAFHQGNTLKIGILSGSGVPSGSSDGIVLAVGIGNSYGHQIHLDDNKNELYHRSMVGQGNNWNSWLKIIDSGNIGSQSVNYATTAGTATNLANNPSIQAGTSDTNKVTITAGGKTSSEFTIPYATRSYRLYSGDVSTGADAIATSVGAYCYRYISITDTDIKPTGGDGFILGFSWGSSSYGAQIYVDTDPTYNISLRQRDASGDWQSWKQIITENNIGSQSVSYATKATNDSDGNAINSTYLKKSGGTMSGTLNMTANTVQVNFRTGHNSYNSKMEYMTVGNEAMVWANKLAATSFIFKCGLDLSDTADWTGITPSLQIKNQSVYINSLIPNDTAPSYNLYVNGSACVSTSAYFSTSSGSVGIGTTNPSYKLHVLGTFYTSGLATFGGDVLPTSNMAQSLGSDSYRWEHIRGKFLWAKGSAPAVYVSNESGNWIALHWATDSNRGLYDSNNWIVGYNGTNTFMGGGNVGIGTSSPSYKLHVSGDIYATGGVTSLSDARHKTIMGDTKLRVEQIAEMPAITYKWIDRRDNDLHVGSIAQNWQRILPEVVSVANDLEGTLSINYGVAAMIASIVTAKKVVDHEARIKALESECERLREENKQLRLKIA